MVYKEIEDQAKVDKEIGDQADICARSGNSRITSSEFKSIS